MRWCEERRINAVGRLTWCSLGKQNKQPAEVANGLVGPSLHGIDRAMISSVCSWTNGHIARRRGATLPSRWSG